MIDNLEVHQSYDEYVMAVAWRGQDGVDPSLRERRMFNAVLELFRAACMTACASRLASFPQSRSSCGGVPPKPLVALLATMEGAREGYDAQSVLGTSRLRPIAYARFRSWRKLRELGYSLPGIGKAYGKDHTTILAGIRSIKKAEAKTTTGMR